MIKALRHAAEDTPSNASPDDPEKVPVFDRANVAENLGASNDLVLS